MGIHLQFSYSPWFVILCLLLGGIYAGLLYYKERTFSEFREEIGYWFYVMTVLRGLTVALIAFLLLSPLVKTMFQKSQPPVILWAQDNSSSIKHGFRHEGHLDTTKLQQYLKKQHQLKIQLADQYELHTYTFGEQVRNKDSISFTEKQTDIAQLFTSLYDQYTNQNVGAVILATDGIYNKGMNPLYVNKHLDAPLYTLALGDTTPKKDIKINEVYHNEIVYLGNKFPVHTHIQAQNCANNTTTLTIEKINAGESNKVLYRKEVSIDKSFFGKEISTTIKAENTGVQHYRLHLSKIEGEMTVANNTKDIFIEVLESKRKVLILKSSPHPDLGALKRAIATQKNYAATIKSPDELEKDVKSYNLAILHQLPTSTTPASATLKALKQNNTPTLFIVGSQTDLPTFNQSQSLLNIKPKSESLDEIQPALDENFSLFTLSQSMQQFLPKLPPLQVPFADFSVSPNTEICLKQKVGQTVTDKPLLLFRQGVEPRQGVLLGENLWRWPLFEYAQHEKRKITESFINKIVQYLSVKADKRRFRVSLPQNTFNENQSIQFEAEFYNKSYELINTPEVTMTITNSAGEQFPFTFNKTSQAYSLNAGTFPVGNYHYKAQTRFNEQSFTAEGEFSVRPLQIEGVQTTANHQLLYSLAQKRDGKLFYPSQSEKLLSDINQRSDIKPITYLDYRTEAFLNLKWVFFLILFLLTGEWFLRKWHGGY